MDNTDNVNDKTNSILNDIKKLLGIAPDYTNFDTDIIININSVFMILNQLGVGPKEGFKITGANETWDNYIDEDDLNLKQIKYIVQIIETYLKSDKVESIRINSIYCKRGSKF